MDGQFGNDTLQNFLNNLKENNNSINFKESVKILQCLLRINKCYAEINGNLDDSTNK